MVKILDCTLRDGGYYTQWDFDDQLVANYFKAFNDLPAEYLEIGYRSNPMKDYLGEYFYCPDYVLANARSLSNKKLAIILNEKDVRAEHAESLLSPCKGVIDLVRIAVAPDNFKRALSLAEAVKKLGFEVSFNVMYMSSWKENVKFLEEIKNANGLVDIFYLVDSYGGVYPEDVIDIMDLVRGRIDCKLGFHGHNNIELALINTLTAIEKGAYIVDGTITGMGRGAGNLKTELLLTALNSKFGVDINFNALSKVVDDFELLQKDYGWGTNLPYMVSGANSLPQKNVMEWVVNRFYSFNSIIRALQNAKKGIEDNQKLEIFAPEKKYKQCVIIGGGPNAVRHAAAVKEFINRRGDICVIHASSKNAKHYNDLENDEFFCLVGSEGHRLEEVFEDLGQFKGKCVLPPFPRKMGTYIPSAVENKCYELVEVEFIDQLKDSHTAIALQTAMNLGVDQILLVGYDGYTGSMISTKEQELFSENELIFSKAIKHTQIKSMVPTLYSIPVQSIYSLI